MNTWKRVYRDAVAAGTAKLDGRRKEERDFLQRVAAAHERSLESLLAAFTDGKIDEDTFRAELAEERGVFKAGLLAAPAIDRRAALGATKAFFDVIDEALDAGIGGQA